MNSDKAESVPKMLISMIFDWIVEASVQFLWLSFRQVKMANLKTIQTLRARMISSQRCNPRVLVRLEGVFCSWEFLPSDIKQSVIDSLNMSYLNPSAA